MSSIRVVPLICPDCGAALAGLRGDQVFFCLVCRQGLEQREGTWQRHPLLLAASPSPPPPPVLHLPFWQLDIKAEVQAKTKQQNFASRHLLGLNCMYVTGFALVRPSYYGDLGQAYTERAVCLQAAEDFPAGFFIAGCSRTIADAARYAKLYSTQIIDKHTDVTGMDINVQITAARLWAVPFGDQGDKIIDSITGATLPAFALDDLEDLRKK
jgi:hypothetical protein